jgi:SSS family solute:Na+ symporter
MLSIYDYIIIVFYFVFVMGIGFVYRKTSKNTSDYFRGGGSMSWWLAGTSSFIAAFSCFTFVAFAGRMYKFGTLWSMSFVANGITGFIVAIFLAHRFRRMRVITPVEAIRRRFGPAAEQLLAWQRVIIVFLFGGSWLYIMSVFLSPIVGWSVPACIIASGVVVTIMSVTGGSWAVAASDFVQALIVISITIIATFFVLRLPEVGGIVGLFEQLPPRMTDWTVVERKPIVIIMLFQIGIMAMLNAANILEQGRRFLYIKSDRDARRAGLLMAIGAFVAPAIWFLPVLASTFLIPDIAEIAPYSSLKNPEEACYVAVCMKILPTGMLGLMVCTLFAATMSSMDTRLNTVSGIIVRNIYKALINKDASEERMLVLSKITTGILGAICIVSGLFFDKLTRLPVNDIYMYMNLYVFAPMVIPLCLAIMIKRTPKWAFYATVFAGLIMTLLSKLFFDAEQFSIAMGWGGNLNERELVDLDVAFRTILVTITNVAVFAGSTIFYRRREGSEYQKNLELFFKDLNTPITSESKEHVHTDALQFRTIGLIALCYGGFVLLGMLIPNSLSGRMAFLFAGGVITTIGGVLYWNYIKCVRRGQHDDAAYE